MQRSRTYAVEVRGTLPSALAGELADFATDASETNTVLTGPIADDAALYGLLARLESLGVSLVSIRTVPDQTGGNPT